MTKHELDSLTVVRGDELEESGIPAGTVELWNCSGLVRTFPNRDAAYTEVLRLRGYAAYLEVHSSPETVAFYAEELTGEQIAADVDRYGHIAAWHRMETAH